jgi:aspartyl/asparaginyl beta-hydroxylase (cupin superfamily)
VPTISWQPKEAFVLVEANSADLLRVAELAASALRRDDPASARPLYEQLVEARPSDTDALVGLALARLGLGDEDGALELVDRTLAAQPRHLRALIMKADYLARSGDARAASTFYAAAVASAPPLETMGLEARAEVRRAQRQMAQISNTYEDHLSNALAAAGFDPTVSSRRFVQAIDLLRGRKRIYFQSPTAFYFPELPQRQFYERDEFPWLASIEAQTEAIRNEFLAVAANEADLRPYIQTDPARPQREYGRLLDSLDWSAFFVVEYGKPIAADRCPAAYAAVQKTPLCVAPGRSPSVFFSLLKPGVRIPPHTGQTNARLIVHLPLIVPDGCGFRVGNETRTWTPGKALIFDDSIEHEAWNESGEQRAVLIFDIWRPELTQDERRLVSALLASVGSYPAS